METATPLNTLELDNDLCIGCGMCVSVCPHLVFTLRENKAEIINYEDCMECGACSMNCPTGAIRVESGVGCAALMIAEALGINYSSCGGSDQSKEKG